MRSAVSNPSVNRGARIRVGLTVATFEQFGGGVNVALTDGSQE
jgi:hypothetical protein